MKLQRIALLLAAMGLVVGMEVVLTRAFTREESLSAPPIMTAVPAASPEAAGQTDVQATLQPVNSLAPLQPGATSPPAYTATQAPAATKPPATKAPATKAPATKAPEPTAPPTEPPDGSVGSTLSSDNFSSNTGTGLNLGVSWKATDLGGGKARINITGTVNSYSLNIGSRSVSINFGNYSASVTGSSINVPNDSLTSTTLFSTSIDVDKGSTGTMTVTWNYNGEYSGTAMSEITASGYVYT